MGDPDGAPPTAPPLDALRAHLRHEAAAAARDAVRDGGDLGAERVARLERLATLVRISESALRPNPRGRRWLAPALIGLTVIVLSALLFIRVPETGIELDITADEVAFTMARRQVLTDLLPVTALGLTGVHGVDLIAPAGAGGAASPYDVGEPVHFAVAADGAGSVSVAPIALPEHGRVLIEYAGTPYRYRLTLERLDEPIDVAVRGSIRSVTAGTGPVLHEYGTPRGVTMVAAGGAMVMDLELAERVALAPQVEVNELSFSRIDELQREERTAVRRLSTILSGTLYLVELEGRAIPLRAGEPIRFHSAQGWLRVVELGEDEISLGFRGRVRGLSTGWGSAERSLMPTQLEWLRARHGLMLLWGAVLYISGIVLTLLRWWRASP